MFMLVVSYIVVVSYIIVVLVSYIVLLFHLFIFNEILTCFKIVVSICSCCSVEILLNFLILTQKMREEIWKPKNLAITEGLQ